MDKQREAIVKAIKEARIYDYVCNHYWEMDKSDLVDLLKEFIYELDCNGCMTEAERQFSRETIIEDLNDRGWGEDDE